MLFEGYVGRGDGDRVAGTISQIPDAETLIVVDPGMVPSRGEILRAPEGARR